MIEIATNKTHKENFKEKHKRDAILELKEESYKLKQDTEHVLKMQLKQGLNKIGDELKIKFMFCDDA